MAHALFGSRSLDAINAPSVCMDAEKSVSRTYTPPTAGPNNATAIGACIRKSDSPNTTGNVLIKTVSVVSVLPTSPLL